MNPPAMLDTLDDTGVLADFADDLAVRRVDPVEEMRLRTWARRNYVPSTERDADWHDVVHDEMARIDGEAAA